MTSHRLIVRLAFVALVALAALACSSKKPSARPDAGTDAGGADAGTDAGRGPVAWECGRTGPDPRFLDEFGAWEEGFVIPGARNAAALATGPDGALYVGGDFDHVSGVPARGIARVTEDGAAALGDGLDGIVTAIVVAADGTVHAATGSTPETWSMLTPVERDLAPAAVHRWDGAAWTEIGAIDGGTVFGLGVDAADRVYAIGDFLEIGGTPARHFAVLEGTTWSEAEALALPATAIHSDDDGVCFAGWVGDPEAMRMKVACGTAGAFVEHALPADFAPRILPGPGGFFGLAPPIAALARDADGALILGGNFVFAGFADGLGSLARWDGTAFVPYAGGVGYDPSSDRTDWGVVQDLALDAEGALAVAGDYTRAGTVGSPQMHGLASVARDGSAWTDIPSGNTRHPGISGGFRTGVGRWRLVARAPGGVAAAAFFSAVEDVASRDVAIHGPGGWMPLAPAPVLRGLDGEVRALAANGADLVAGGAFVTDGAGGVHPYLAVYRDGAWSGVATPPPGPVAEVAIEDDGTIWASAAPSEFEGAVVLLRGDGGTLTEIARASGGDLAPEIVAILPTGDGRAFVAGTFTMLGGVAARSIAEVEGGTIRALAGGLEGRVDGLTLDAAGDLVAVGSFTVPAAHVARWRGGAWEPLGAGVPTELTGVALHEGEIVVSARFDPSVVGDEALISCFDGTTWHDVVSSAIPWVSGGTTRLLSAGGTLVLVGQIPYDPADPTLSTKVAVFTGDSWRPVDSARGDLAFDAAAAESGFWLGGSFSVVAGTPSDQIAFFELAID